MGSYTSTQVRRLPGAGAVPAAQTTASEFGGVNYIHTRLHGTTRNPWNTRPHAGRLLGRHRRGGLGRHPPPGHGGRRGWVHPHPGRLHRHLRTQVHLRPHPPGALAHHTPLTVVLGCISRSVRDTARWFDVCNGYDPGDTLSLPRVDGWERDLGTHVGDLRAKRAAIVVDIGDAIVRPEVADLVTARPRPSSPTSA